MTLLRRCADRRSIFLCDERRAREDEQSDHAVIANDRCTPARRPPSGVLSVDLGTQLQEEPDGVEVAVVRCNVKRAPSIGPRLVDIRSQFREKSDRISPPSQRRHAARRASVDRVGEVEICARLVQHAEGAAGSDVKKARRLTRRRAPERAITCYKRKVHSAWGDFTDPEKLCVGSRDHESSDPKGWFAESVALVPSVGPPCRSTL